MNGQLELELKVQPAWLYDAELLIGSAIRHRGVIYTGAGNHPEIYFGAHEQVCKFPYDPEGTDQPECLRECPLSVDYRDTEQGFLTNKGRFVDREEGYEVAQRTNMIQESSIEIRRMWQTQLKDLHTGDVNWRRLPPVDWRRIILDREDIVIV
jgi:hypothetical protein